jgi:hypothetical protein
VTRHRQPDPEPRGGTWEITWASDTDGGTRERRELVDADGQDLALLRGGAAAARRITAEGLTADAVVLRGVRLLTRREAATQRAWLRVMEVHARHAPDNLPPGQCRMPGCVAAMRGILELPEPGSARQVTAAMDYTAACAALASAGCDAGETREVLMQARRDGTAPFGLSGGIVTAEGLWFTIGQYRTVAVTGAP